MKQNEFLEITAAANRIIFDYFYIFIAKKLIM